MSHADRTLATVRRFNRTVTQRVGALDDSFLSRTRPLAQARILFEIDNGHNEVRQLRAHLDLDSGYLTRLLQALEREGLITIEEDPADRRVRRATLTAAGRAERAEYERLSDEHAAGILTALDDKQQTTPRGCDGHRRPAAHRLDDRVRRRRPRAPCRARGDRPVPRRARRALPQRVRQNGTISATDDEVRLPRGITLLATLHGEPAALGLLKFHDGTTHLKRMWVSPDLRGLGLGRRLLTTLEAHAAEHGIHTIQLETNFALTEAIALYRAAGYVEVPPFNDEPNGDLWFEKASSEEIGVS